MWRRELVLAMTQKSKSELNEPLEWLFIDPGGSRDICFFFFILNYLFKVGADVVKEFPLLFHWVLIDREVQQCQSKPNCTTCRKHDKMWLISAVRIQRDEENSINSISD